MPAGRGRPNGLFIGVNEALDPSNLSDLEKKHIPRITAPDVVRLGQRFELEVEVGKAIPHPSEHRHFIQCVDIYADDTFLASVGFGAVTTPPVAKLCIVLHHRAKELRAYERCNLHGTWVGRRAITVNQ
ncbi:hypothetical protein LCGC14_1641590 [marine sediment metagenome]|uniref:Desulfoferrodoxin ferrous iron-binding domain-containing protein n=1 Tax=marine sediment metagenome TaxID=412755 RepID=A0A0F9KFA3_9ZZZZ